MNNELQRVQWLLFASMLMDRSSDETTWKISAGPLVDVRAYIVHGTVNFNIGRFLDSKCFIQYFLDSFFLPFYKRRMRGSVVGYKHRWARLLKQQWSIDLPTKENKLLLSISIFHLQQTNVRGKLCCSPSQFPLCNNSFALLKRSF
jgi:hypothetical protein